MAVLCCDPFVTTPCPTIPSDVEGRLWGEKCRTCSTFTPHPKPHEHRGGLQGRGGLTAPHAPGEEETERVAWRKKERVAVWHQRSQSCARIALPPTGELDGLYLREWVTTFIWHQLLQPQRKVKKSPPGHPRHQTVPA